MMKSAERLLLESRLLFVPDRGELRSKTGDVIVLSGEAFRGLIKETCNFFKSWARIIWLEAGRGAGKADAVALRSARETSSMNKFMELVSNLYTAFGWGIVKLSRFDYKRRRSEVVVYNSAPARGEKSGEPACWFISGFIEGMFQELFNTKARCRETVCAATGKDRCIFKVSW